MKVKKKILIVDDQKLNRAILANMLSEFYEIQEAANGKDALDILKKNGEDISAILLDLIMPEMDGYEVLRAMGESPDLSAIPVIVVSQADRHETEEMALALGARDFVSKPYNPRVLHQRIENLIELYESNTCIRRIERDPITGIYNKDGFCRVAAGQLEAQPDTKFMLVATDIERFKLVNDGYGTEAGNSLLSYIAEELQGAIKGFGGICARTSADHFVALVPASIDDGHLKSVVALTKDSLANYPLPMKVSLKFGVYPITDLATPLSIMCDRAIIAAESVKGKYDNPCAYYDDSIRQKLMHEQQILDEMKTALQEEQFQVYLQPKYNLSSEHIAGAEALVRWIHPKLGFLNPGEFIPLFENNGFITELDKYVWEKTCSIIADWMKCYQTWVPVSVNVSRKDIYKEDLPEYFTKLTQRYGLQPKQLHLEITETAYTENPEQLINVVKRLKEKGFIIEMDDFGSGYSSLNMLSELPIDIIKLDMLLIQRETKKRSRQNILDFVINLARWMHLLVVAEGVETQEQIELLRKLNCDYVQGYYYAKPMKTDEFTQLLVNTLSENEQAEKVGK